MPPQHQQGYPTPGPVQPKGLAIAALIVGIVSLIFCWVPFIGILGGIAAVILGIIALKKAQSKGMSLTGLITGGVAILASVVILIVSLVFINAALNTASSAIDELDQYSSELEDSGSGLGEDPSDSEEDFGASGSEEPAEPTGDRSAEFCTAFNTFMEESSASGAELTEGLATAAADLSAIDSPNADVYERLSEYVSNPTAMTEDETFMSDYMDAMSEDGMACL